MKNIISKSLAYGTAAASMAPLLSFAQAGPGAVLPPTGTGFGFTTITGILCTLLGWAFTLLMVVTVFFILYAAYLYLTGGGEEEAVKKANHQLVYAAIAVVLAIVSRGVPYLIASFVPGGAVTGC